MSRHQRETDLTLERRDLGADADVDQYAPPGAVERPRRLASEARARRSDPETSHAAAKSVDDLNAKQRAVLLVLQISGSMTDEELLDAYALTSISDPRDVVPEQSASGIRTRRRELADAGLVVDTGERRKSRSGRAAIVWSVA